jgi:hypothetical protein
MQLLLSLPFTPSTYHVVLARTVGTAADKMSDAMKIDNLDFMASSFLF